MLCTCPKESTRIYTRLDSLGPASLSSLLASVLRSTARLVTVSQELKSVVSPWWAYGGMKLRRTSSSCSLNGLIGGPTVGPESRLLRKF